MKNKLKHCLLISRVTHLLWCVFGSLEKHIFEFGQLF